MIEYSKAYRIGRGSEIQLLQEDETGMGYQVIYATGDINYSSFAQDAFVVVNSEIAVRLKENYYANDWATVRLAISSVLDKPNDFVNRYEINFSGIQVIERYRANTSSICTDEYYRKRGRIKGGEAAVNSAQRQATENDKAVRVSAFKNDRRIDFDNMCLRKGSFTTTLADHLVCVQKEDEPIDRYALPSDKRIEYSFFIKPTISDKLQEGIVQPAFHKCGGGAEFFFSQGTRKNTLKSYGDYGKIPDSFRAVSR